MIDVIAPVIEPVVVPVGEGGVVVGGGVDELVGEVAVAAPDVVPLSPPQPVIEIPIAKATPQ